PAPTSIYTLSLHDALPISLRCRKQPQEVVACRTRDARKAGSGLHVGGERVKMARLMQRHIPDGVRHEHRYCVVVAHHHRGAAAEDRKSTRLNSSHRTISYA